MSGRKPAMLPEPLKLYPMNGKYPDQLRVCFDAGSTQIYDLQVKQPHPIIQKNIEIIRRMCVGYERKEKTP